MTTNSTRRSDRLQVTPEPAYNMFPDCAEAARADYLGHFPPFWKSTKIIFSREFLSRTSPHLA
jgi:hypothetical protein